MSIIKNKLILWYVLNVNLVAYDMSYSSSGTHGKCCGTIKKKWKNMLVLINFK